MTDPHVPVVPLTDLFGLKTRSDFLPTTRTTVGFFPGGSSQAQVPPTSCPSQAPISCRPACLPRLGSPRASIFPELGSSEAPAPQAAGAPTSGSSPNGVLPPAVPPRPGVLPGRLRRLVQGTNDSFGEYKPLELSGNIKHLWSHRFEPGLCGVLTVCGVWGEKLTEA